MYLCRQEESGSRRRKPTRTRPQCLENPPHLIANLELPLLIHAAPCPLDLGLATLHITAVHQHFPSPSLLLDPNAPYSTPGRTSHPRSPHKGISANQHHAIALADPEPRVQHKPIPSTDIHARGRRSGISQDIHPRKVRLRVLLALGAAVVGGEFCGGDWRGTGRGRGPAGADTGGRRWG